jgi:tripartite-type tricarboxylate transporter receptor subunit TctC
MKRILNFVVAAAALALGAWGAPASAEYPEKPIRLIVPFAQGGATDTVGRMIATPLEQKLGQPVIVVNQPGAGGAVGIANMVQARPDGYTLAVGANDSISARPLMTESGYTIDDIEPIAMVADGPIGIAVRSDSPYQTIDDLIAAMKAGTVNWSSPGAGTGPHLATEAFLDKAGLEAAHVNSASAKEALLKVLSGEVVFVAATGSNFPSMISESSGGIRALALMAEERWDRLPDVPTFREQGHDMIATQWFGLVAPKGTPKEVIDVLAEEVRVILDSAEADELLAKFHFSGAYLPPAEFGDKMRQEAEALKPVLEKIGMAKK